MSIRFFRSDLHKNSESDYYDWLKDNPNGFVVNTQKSTRGNATKSDYRFTRLHRAECKTINPLLCKTEKSGFTTGKYQKICASSLELAEAEAKSITGLGTIKKCRCI